MSWPREELQPFRQWCKKVGLSHHARLEGGTRRSESKRECESKCLHEVEIGKMVFDFDIDNDQLSSLRLRRMSTFKSDRQNVTMAVR